VVKEEAKTRENGAEKITDDEEEPESMETEEQVMQVKPTWMQPFLDYMIQKKLLKIQ
jgi:CHASE3 domain sensor protein